MLQRILGEVDDVIVFSNGRLTPVIVGERRGLESPFKLFLPEELLEVTRRLGLSDE